MMNSLSERGWQPMPFKKGTAVENLNKALNKLLEKLLENKCLTPEQAQEVRQAGNITNESTSSQ